MGELKYNGYMAAIHYLVLCNKRKMFDDYKFDVGCLVRVNQIADPHQNYYSIPVKEAWEITIWYTKPIKPDPTLYKLAGLEKHKTEQLYPVCVDTIFYKYACSFILNPDWHNMLKSKANLGEISLEDVCKLQPYMYEGTYPEYRDILPCFILLALDYLKLI